MGKKSGPKAPTPPDPMQTAQAQTTMNKETAVANANLNRINQYTPEGSLIFNQIGTNADGTPKYESRQTYSPEQQQLYSQDAALSSSLNQTAMGQLGRVNQAMGQGIDRTGMPEYQTGVPTTPIQGDIGYGGPGVQYGFDKGGPVQGQIGATRGFQSSFGGYGNVPTEFGDAGQIQKGLDYSGVSRLPGTDDFAKQSQEVNDAVYKQATSRLDPRFQQEYDAKAASLASKGVTEGSAAYQREMENFGRTKNDAYNQATYSGIQAGADRQGQLFGMGLQARQQGVGEVNTQGGFANAAQQQAYQQAQGRGQFGADQQQRQYEQSRGQAEFGNTAAEAEFQQAQARGQFGNAAQQQQYDQNQGQADFANQAQQQGYGQAASNAAFRNTAAGQQFSQGQANLATNNQVRDSMSAERAYDRNLPLNDIAALMGSSAGVSQPQFANYASANVANTDYSSLVQNQYAQQNAQYQAKQANRSAGLGQLFGLAGSAAMKFSDKRLKADIQRIGQTAAGIPTYTFRYIWDGIKRFGVMADEVLKAIPDAVSQHESGYLMVDYGKVR